MKITRTILFLSSLINIISSIIIVVFNDSFNIHGPGIRIVVILASFYSMLIICLFLIIGFYLLVSRKAEKNNLNITAMLVGVVSVGIQFIISILA